MLKNGIIKAYIFAEEKHKGQKRKFTDLDYFVHPKMVARRIEELTNNVDLIIAALTHDLIEDTDTTLEELEQMFGPKVAMIVSELTSDKEEIKRISKKEYLKKKLNTWNHWNLSYVARNALLIKLADREHNIKFLIEDTDLSSEESMKFLKKYYEETKYIISDLNDLSDKANIIYQSILEILKEIEDILKIPKGHYCTNCPHYNIQQIDNVSVAYCNFLKLGSLIDLNDEDYKKVIKKLNKDQIENYKSDLLWDKIKECNINLY